MKKHIQNIFCLILLLFVSGCNRNIAIKKEVNKTEDIKVLIYNSGVVKHKFKIQKDTPLFIELQKWAMKNNSGWSLTYETYVPQVYTSFQKIGLLTF